MTSKNCFSSSGQTETYSWTEKTFPSDAMGSTLSEITAVFNDSRILRSTYETKPIINREGNTSYDIQPVLRTDRKNRTEIPWEWAQFTEEVPVDQHTDKAEKKSRKILETFFIAKSFISAIISPLISIISTLYFITSDS